MVNLYCVQLLSLWSFVAAAPGNKHTDRVKTARGAGWDRGSVLHGGTLPQAGTEVEPGRTSRRK